MVAFLLLSLAAPLGGYPCERGEETNLSIVAIPTGVRKQLPEVPSVHGDSAETGLGEIIPMEYYGPNRFVGACAKGAKRLTIYYEEASRVRHIRAVMFVRRRGIWRRIDG
jgi:hypothetical protein